MDNDFSVYSVLSKHENINLFSSDNPLSKYLNRIEYNVGVLKGWVRTHSINQQEQT